MVAETVFRILSSINIGAFLGLFIPGMVTVFGSYLLYRRRQKDRSRRLRRSIWGEITAISRIDRAVGHGSRAAVGIGMIPTTVYDSNAGELGLLTDDEVTAVVQYYTSVKALDSMLELARGNDVENIDVLDQLIDHYLGKVSANQEQAISSLSANMSDVPSGGAGSQITIGAISENFREYATEGSASVILVDQVGSGEKVIVDSLTLPEGGFVAIHDETVTEEPFQSIRGFSGYLEAGAHQSITVTLDNPLNTSEQVYAIPFRDTNQNESFDFLSTEGIEDGPYLNNEELIVLSGAEYDIIDG